MIAALILLAGGRAWAGASANIPVGSRVYGELERLEVKGLIKSGALSTRPFGRAEASRLVHEALENAARSGEKGRAAMPVISRLEREFRFDSGQASFLKPLERAYAGYLYSDRRPYFPSINNNGREFEQRHNLSIGFSSAAGFRDTLTVHFTPEYRLDDEEKRVEFLDAYVKAGIGPFEFQAGKDSMWWGQGYHGSLLMTNNAEPLEMIRVIGHHMGPDATDLFIRGQYHSPGGMVVGVEADLERSLVHEGGKTQRKWISADASLPFGDGFRFLARAGAEQVSGPATDYTNPVAGINLERSF